MIISKHFIIIGVRATGRYSLRQLTAGIGTIVMVLKKLGTTVSCSKSLKTLVKSPSSWLAHVFSVWPGPIWSCCFVDVYFLQSGSHLVVLQKKQELLFEHQHLSPCSVVLSVRAVFILQTTVFLG